MTELLAPTLLCADDLTVEVEICLLGALFLMRNTGLFFVMVVVLLVVVAVCASPGKLQSIGTKAARNAAINFFVISNSNQCSQ
ncbi:MAG: hypothetical protein DKT66_24910 [Candidatus Melainabacteria bacterium]|nr:MAG: hypothetical protein DKT66_24910 [Candidatus Melainabacteria bacterium]